MSLKVITLTIVLVLVMLTDYVNAGAQEIVAAARSQIGVPYVFGGGNINGKTNGGFDCSGLAQYSVHKGTGKVIARTASAQYTDKQCHQVPYASRQAGDLVFFTGHVGIVSGANTLIHAPKPGDHVREATIWSADRLPMVQRCY